MDLNLIYASSTMNIDEYRSLTNGIGEYDGEA